MESEMRKGKGESKRVTGREMETGNEKEERGKMIKQTGNGKGGKTKRERERERNIPLVFKGSETVRYRHYS